MIRRRIPLADDRFIYRLIRLELLPYTRRVVPDYRLGFNKAKRRLNRSVTYVATSGNKGVPLGFISCMRRKDHLWIDLLAVERSHQGKGIGAALIRRAEKLARFWRRPYCALLVDWTNESAQRFYAKHGYVSGGYDSKNECLLMTKLLLPAGLGRK